MIKYLYFDLLIDSYGDQLQALARTQIIERKLYTRRNIKWLKRTCLSSRNCTM